VVECVVVRDRASGDSRGFGFVRMASEAAAANAIQALSGYHIGE
jgi:RNA recognition motif-containing protein